MEEEGINLFGTTDRAFISSYRNYLLRRAQSVKEFSDQLRKDDLFNKKEFFRVRVQNGSQSDMARLAGVSQATIGNWERGTTYPNSFYRKSLLRVSDILLDQIRARVDQVSGDAGIDPVETQARLNNSILRAALTDFQFDRHSAQIVAVPFEADSVATNVEAIEEDRRNLLASLAEQAEIIASGLAGGANTETKHLIQYLNRYGSQCRALKPNPRLLHRLGETITNRTNEDDVRFAISGWDSEAIDGFQQDHTELMRLYFRAALARAQEIEAAAFEGHVEEPDPAQFQEIADKIEQVTDEDGASLVDEGIPTLLRDIAREIRNLKEAEIFTTDEARRAVYRRRRIEAIKNGSIYVGRFLFFTSLFVVVPPAVSLSVVGSLASIVGVLEAAAPGTVRRFYDRLRESFPILPPLPSAEKSKTQRD